MPRWIKKWIFLFGKGMDTWKRERGKERDREAEGGDGKRRSSEAVIRFSAFALSLSNSLSEACPRSFLLFAFGFTCLQNL